MAQGQKFFHGLSNTSGIRHDRRNVQLRHHAVHQDQRNACLFYGLKGFGPPSSVTLALGHDDQPVNVVGHQEPHRRFLGFQAFVSGRDQSDQAPLTSMAFHGVCEIREVRIPNVWDQ